MRQIAYLVLTGAVVFLPDSVVAQTYKCTDAAGKITYTGAKCADLGLTEVGEVKDRVTVSPAYRPPPSAPKAPAPEAAAGASAAPKAAAPPAPEKSAEP